MFATRTLDGTALVTRSGSIAVLGGSGFIGRHILDHRQAIVAGKRTTFRFLLHRLRPRWLSAEGIEVHHVDLDSAVSLERALQGCQGLVNLMRPDGSGCTHALIGRALSALPSDARILLHASSIDVYGDAAGTFMSEYTKPMPPTPYAKEHLEIEGLFAAGRGSGIILRLGAVFGVGGRNLLRMADQVAAEPAWKLTLRRALNGRRRLHLVAAEFVAATICRLVTSGASSPRLVLLTQDDEDENNFAFVQDRFLQAFGRSIPSVGFAPAGCLIAAGKMLGRSIVDPRRRISTDRLLEFDLRPPRPFQESIDRYVAHLARVKGIRDPR